MRTLVLQRLKQSSMGTIGIIKEDGKEICQTLEKPWVDVELDGISDKNVSCINADTYICKRVHSPKFGEVFEITNVPNRDHILIHNANFLRELLGCVAVGLQSGESNGEYCVYKSKIALEHFMKNLEGVKEFRLEIKDVP